MSFIRAHRELPLHRLLRRPLLRRAMTPPTSRSRRRSKAASKAGPPNMIFYATSNRRHLLPRDMMENERSTAINPSEAVQEKVSLSDRFGLWLGFHNCSQDEYLRDDRRLMRGTSSLTDFARTNCARARSNGRRRAAAVPAASPGSISRMSRAGSASASRSDSAIGYHGSAPR